MRKKIYVSICLLSVLTILLTTILTLSVCYNQFSSQIKKDLINEAKLIAAHLNDNADDKGFLMGVKNTSKRITLISADGDVLFDSSIDISKMENHNNRTEVILARAEGFGESERLSDTLKVKTFYYAAVLDDSSVLRIAQAADSIFSMFIDVVPTVFAITLVILIFALFVAKYLTKNIVLPINKIDLDNVHDEEIYDELLPFIKRITEQNKKIYYQMEQLKRQKTRLNIISENMNEGLLVLDGSGLVLSINNSALKIFGLEKSDIIGKSFLYLTRHLEMIEHIKYALNGKNGTTVVNIGAGMYELFYSPVFENNAVCGAMLLLFDVSEKIKAEKIRREFSANVSHELKTPLTTILGYSQMINSGMAKQGDIKSFTLKIEKEAKRLILLTEDIIKLSSLDEQSGIKDMQRVNLFEIANYMAEVLESKIKEKGIKINIYGEDTFVKGNKSMLEELVFNLYDNGIKYNKDGGSINVSIKDKSICVSDTGIGIPKESIERIFERFYQVDSSRSKKISGTGLGLSIVKHIAILHSAQITVNSKLGKGTEIIVGFNGQPHLGKGMQL
jgi:two-component system phosphate regulon sensor histidine kinase PhoR